MRISRNALTGVALLLAALSPVAAQDSDHEAALKAKLAKKLARPFVKKIAWVHDLATAKKQATEGKKFIFAYFTRSFAP